jgi:hypothetical protein
VEERNKNMRYWIFVLDDRALIETDFRKQHVVEALRRRLSTDFPRSCFCPMMLARQRLPVTSATNNSDSPFVKAFECVARRPNGSELWRCRATEAWPDTFDEFGATWPSGYPRWSSSAAARTFRHGIAGEYVLGEL